MTNLDRLDAALSASIEQLKDSAFYQQVTQGKNTRALYIRYLQYAYHYVRMTSSFTPLAAQRMNPKFMAVRKWILEHSSEEIGHENMALLDLAQLGFDKESTQSSKAPVGVIAWTSFFHYKVTVDNPFCAFGVLYFLEGMARQLAPDILKPIMGSLGAEEKGAIRFFKEHGDLDQDHMAEQTEILGRTELSAADEDAIVDTIVQAAQIKRFMLDQLVKDVEEKQ
jgi:pyrroloquinoline quinone (PQQ) biosynthesis protein C